jgi:hypothetical protein
VTHCLVYSVKNHKNHLDQLKRSLESVRDYVMPFVSDLDIIFFYDEGTQPVIAGFMKELWMNNRVFLRPFTAGPLDYPPHIKAKIVGNKSYNNMCRFWAGVVFTDPQVGQYDHYMRLDCDSFFTGPIGRNIFEEVNSANAIYGYFPGGIQHDDSPHSEDLNKTIKEFEIQYKGNLFGTIDDVREGMLYYTNFEICNTAAFLNSGYMDLFHHLDLSGGIYMYRWGDHIIRYAGVHMFWPQGAAYEIPGCSYTHQGYSIINGVRKES